MPLVSRTQLPSPIRLAFVVHSFDTGGQERCIAALVNGLPEDRFEATVISFKAGGAAAGWIQRPGVPVIGLGKRYPNDPRLVLRLARVLKQRQIHVAHSHNWGTLVEAGLACRLANTFHVHAEHGLGFGDNTAGVRGQIKPVLKKAFFRRADAVVAIAECVKTKLVEIYQCPPERVAFIPNGVSPLPVNQSRRTCYDAVRAELNLPADSLIAGTVGRVARVKGYDFAIRSFQAVSKTLPNAHLVIVGDGPEKDSLQSLCVELDLADRVHFAGHQDDVGSWLAGFDLFFNSSRSEAMNLAILEAMASGLPIVAVDVGDNARLVEGHGACGLVTPVACSREFAQALERLLRSPRLRDEFGARAASVHQESFSLNAMLESYSILYQQVTAKSFVQARTC